MIGSLYFAAQLHRVRGFIGKRRAAVLAGAVAAVLASTGALAYMLAIGTGQGSYTSQTPIQNAQTAALQLTVTPLSPGPMTGCVIGGGQTVDTTWQLGDCQQFDVRIDNPGGNPPVKVNGVTFTWGIQGKDVSQILDSFQMTGSAPGPAQGLQANNHMDEMVQINFVNLPSVDQSAIQGAPGPTFTFTVN